ncbi:hypothetical protein HanIR_Chr02g0073551 [Helianthus annuus]|nr:hypothetical protein HanIR_Chr02g0073551 [Helianthus annuus]
MTARQEIYSPAETTGVDNYELRVIHQFPARVVSLLCWFLLLIFLRAYVVGRYNPP